jgi:hypothetical protein
VTTDPRPAPASRPGLAYWLLALVAVPAAGVPVISYVQFSARGGGFHDGIWLESVAVIALLAAGALGWLPQLRRLPRRARLGWVLTGVVLAVVLAFGSFVAFFVGALIIGCTFFDSCLT